jgi:methylenetetrahydrofolate reductase (NADPH)
MQPSPTLDPPVARSAPAGYPGLPVRAVPPRLSFEFFPPKPTQSLAAFWDTVADLALLGPQFCSVTYGAGGATQRATGAIAAAIQERHGMAAAAHLTCVDATCAEIDGIAEDYWRSGIRHIVALRGDPRDGVGGVYRPRPDGYAYADALVAGLARRHAFEISVAAYPETHPQAAGPAADLDHLKRKIDSGASRAITQFCFDMVAFERFLDRCTRAGISVPIAAGILPIVNFARLESFAAACGAHLPVELRRAAAGIDDEPQRRHRFAVDLALAQCAALARLGISDFHFYTLNRAELVTEICGGLGWSPPAQPAAN